MITGFYFFRRWFERLATIGEPFMYESESVDYLDALFTYSTNRGINPDTLIHAVESF